MMFPFAILIALMLPIVASAESVVGRVTDLYGSPLPTARVNCFNSSGSSVATATTDLQGTYQFTNLAAGTYTLEIGLSGFSLLRQQFVVMNDDSLHLQHALRVGQLTDPPDHPMSLSVSVNPRKSPTEQLLGVSAAGMYDPLLSVRVRMTRDGAVVEFMEGGTYLLQLRCRNSTHRLIVPIRWENPPIVGACAAK